MSLFLKVVVTLVLVGLFIAGLVNVMTEIISRFSSDSLPRVRESDFDESEYDEHEMLIGGGRDGVAHS